MQIVKCKRGQFATMQAQPGFVYCGRKGYGYPASLLANPFRVGRDGTLPEVLAKYRRTLFTLWQCPPSDLFRKGVLQTVQRWHDSTVLGCWCVDKDAGTGEEQCHCDVLYKFWKWVQTQR